MTDTLQQQRPKGAVLTKGLKPSWVYALAVGTEIGWGAFILPYGWLENSGLAATALGFLIATALIGVIAVNYGLAVRSLPVTGGGIFFALTSAGRIPGFIAGWALALGYIGIVALNASAVTLVFRVALPGLTTRWELYQFVDWTIYLPEVIIAFLFIALFAYINIKGIKFSGLFQLISVLVLLTSVGLILISLLWKLLHGEVQLVNVGGSGDFVAGTFAIVAIAPWAFVGFDSIPQLAGEFSFKPNKVLLLLVAGIISGSAVYLSMTLSTALSMEKGLAHYSDSAWPTADAVFDTIGGLGLALMILGVSAGVLTGLNGFTASASRVLLTMGRTKMIPAPFAKVNPNTKTPVFAILFVALVCMLTPWFGRSVLGWVVDMTSVGISVAYFFTNFFLLKKALGIAMPSVETAQCRNYGVAALAISGCIMSLFFLALLLVPSMPSALGMPSIIALAGWVILGAVLLLANARQFMKLDRAAIERAIAESA